MRFLMMVLIGLVLGCGDGDRSVPAGPAGKVSADCSLVEILSGKEGCPEDPSLDEVPAGYVAPVDSTATAPSDSTGTETETAPSDSTGTETAPADSTEPEAETPSDTSGSDPVVPDPVVIQVPVEEEPEPEVARSEEETLTAEQSAARAELTGQGVAYTADAFVDSAGAGNLSVVKLFVQAGMGVDTRISYNSTALHVAARQGHLAVVKFLVGAGADLEATNEYGWTALLFAARAGHLDVVEFLVGAGADVDATSLGKTARDWAAERGHRAIVVYLNPPIRAELESKGIAYTGAAFRLAAQSGDLATVKLFVAAGMDLESADDDLGWTALYEAAYAGRLEVVKYLVGAGANIFARDEDGYTVLMNAAGIANNLSVVRFLVESGADVLAVAADGKTAWSVAVTVGNTAIADYLKSQVSPAQAARTELARRGIDYSTSALSRAAATGDLEVVKLFVATGVDVDIEVAVGGWTALMIAAGDGHLDVVQFLVGAGADVNAKTDSGWTALYRAAFRGDLAVDLAVVKYLVGAGADVNATTNFGATPLHEAARWGHLEMVKYLVGAGADVTATTNGGGTPRDRAVQCSTNTVLSDVQRANCAAVVSYFDSLDDDDDDDE